MTEIPEHLLRRSRERRQALGLPTGGGEGGSEPPAGGPPAGPAAEGAPTPAPAAAATPATRPAPAPPPPPKPEPAYVRAARQRRKIPFWAMPALALLPLWAFMYAQAMRPAAKTVTGPLAEGATVYEKCSSCHGSSGEGGVGYPLWKGEVLKTFPKLEDQVTFVEKGTAGYQGQVYGDPNRAGGAHVGGARGVMPTWQGQLTTVEIIAVVCHERYTLSAGDQTSQEFLDSCAPDAPKFAAAEAAG